MLFPVHACWNFLSHVRLQQFLRTYAHRLSSTFAFTHAERFWPDFSPFAVIIENRARGSNPRPVLSRVEGSNATFRTAEGEGGGSVGARYLYCGALHYSITSSRVYTTRTRLQSPFDKRQEVNITSKYRYLPRKRQKGKYDVKAVRSLLV